MKPASNKSAAPFLHAMRSGRMAMLFVLTLIGGNA
jgi:hypothetical protein